MIPDRQSNFFFELFAFVRSGVIITYMTGYVCVDENFGNFRYFNLKYFDGTFCKFLRF